MPLALFCHLVPLLMIAAKPLDSSCSCSPANPCFFLAISSASLITSSTKLVAVSKISGGGGVVVFIVNTF
uniref:Putative secreted protein n=1 Tax=Panstrongylus lignarius TaxID=156445 RepID=A0A224XY01_9HEMI